jgi:hypothetical protein
MAVASATVPTSIRTIITLSWRSDRAIGHRVDVKHKVYMLSRTRQIFSLSLIFMSFFLDLLGARLLLQGRHYAFAFWTLTVSWFAIMKELPTWLVLRNEVRASLKQGYFSDDLVSMRRTERGIEGFVDMVIAFYVMPWAFDRWSQCIQVALWILFGMRGVVSQLYVRDQWRRHEDGFAAAGQLPQREKNFTPSYWRKAGLKKIDQVIGHTWSNPNNKNAAERENEGIELGTLSVLRSGATVEMPQSYAHFEVPTSWGGVTSCDTSMPTSFTLDSPCSSPTKR